MNNHRFTLQPYKGPHSRHICPACKDKRKTFVQYIDTENNDRPLSTRVGRCSRQEKCGYHLTPKMWFAEHNDPSHNRYTRTRSKQETELRLNLASYIPANLRERSEGHYEQNHFVTYLHSTFSAETVERLCKTYHIGTSKHWPGANIFWQIDEKGRTRTGKIMLYDPVTGRRVKEPFSHINWIHSLKDGAGQPLFPGYNLCQCLFGEHLLKDHKEKTVCLVESEKTAMIASVLLPKFLWLATGSLNGLTKERCKALQFRKVIIYPNLGSYDKWKEKAKMLFYNYEVSDVLERHASAGEKAIGGLDIADVLVG